MNVHRLTVLKAYQLLKQHDKVYVKDKSGYFVQSIVTKYIECLDQDNPIVSAYVKKKIIYPKSISHLFPIIFLRH